MKFYYFFGVCLLLLYIVVNEVGIVIMLDKVDCVIKVIVLGEDYMEVNFKGYVLVLCLDDGEVFIEGVVIVQYLVDFKFESGLVLFYGMLVCYCLQEIFIYINFELYKSYSLLFNLVMLDEIWVEWIVYFMCCYVYIEVIFGKQLYLLGEYFMVVDVYLFIVIQWVVWVGFDLGLFLVLVQYQCCIVEWLVVQDVMCVEGLFKQDCC